MLPSIAAQCVRRAIIARGRIVLIISLVHSAGRRPRDSTRGHDINYSTPVQYCFAVGHILLTVLSLLGGQASKQTAVATKLVEFQPTTGNGVLFLHYDSALLGPHRALFMLTAGGS